MTCKDCLHYEAHKHFYQPKDWNKGFDDEMDDENVEVMCPYFESRNDYAKIIHAHWDFFDYVKYDGHGDGIQHPMVRCSNCKHSFRAKLMWVRSYCPNCGAKMDRAIDNN